MIYGIYKVHVFDISPKLLANVNIGGKPKTLMLNYPLVSQISLGFCTETAPMAEGFLLVGLQFNINQEG